MLDVSEMSALAPGSPGDSTVVLKDSRRSPFIVGLQLIPGMARKQLPSNCPGRPLRPALNKLGAARAALLTAPSRFSWRASSARVGARRPASRHLCKHEDEASDGGRLQP